MLGVTQVVPQGLMEEQVVPLHSQVLVVLGSGAVPLDVPQELVSLEWQEVAASAVVQQEALLGQALLDASPVVEAYARLMLELTELAMAAGKEMEAREPGRSGTTVGSPGNDLICQKVRMKVHVKSDCHP